MNASIGSLGLLFCVWSATHGIALTDFSARWLPCIALRLLLSTAIGLLYAFTPLQWCWTVLWLCATALLDILLLPTEDLRCVGGYYLLNAVLLIALYYLPSSGGWTGQEDFSLLSMLQTTRWAWSIGLILLAGPPSNHMVRAILRSCDSPPSGKPRVKPAGFPWWRTAGVAETAAAEFPEPDDQTGPTLAVGRGRPSIDPDSLLASADENPRLGKVIGILERLLIITLVATDSYAALGFIIGAKGFVRYRKLADERFAEYFLIGTLTSALLGILLGLGVKAVW